LAFTFFLARRYDQATEQGAKILELDPKFISAYYIRGVAFVKKSMYKEAMAEFEKAVSPLMISRRSQARDTVMP
jgi:Tfp pilus assembly protein PilF